MRVVSVSAPEAALYVVLATAGRPTLLRRTLQSLAACEKPANYRETIVVENGPREGAEAIVGAFGDSLRARYLHVPLANKSNALNVALEPLEENDLVFFTDDDVRFDSRVLTMYAEAGRKYGIGHFFGGPTGADYERTPPEWLLPYLPGSAKGLAYAAPSGTTMLGNVFLGCNWGAFAGDIMVAGGFNQLRGPGSGIKSTGQESDMQVRLTDSGCKGLYLSDAMVWHYVPKERCSPSWTLKRAYRFGIGVGLDTPELTGPHFCGYPLRLLVEWCRRTAMLMMLLVFSSRKIRFRALCNWAHCTGKLRGVRYALMAMSRKDFA